MRSERGAPTPRSRKEEMSKTPFELKRPTRGVNSNGPTSAKCRSARRSYHETRLSIVTTGFFWPLAPGKRDLEARFADQRDPERRTARSFGRSGIVQRAKRSHVFAPSTSPWVTRMVRGQPWEVESRTQ